MNPADLNRRPFNFLPLNNGDIFDLTCEFLLSKLERLYQSYNLIMSNAEMATKNTIGFKSARAIFNEIDQFINDYSQMVKSVKLSLVEYVGTSVSKHTILEPYQYNINNPLHEDVQDLRNTSQHFEERIQDYHTTVDSFL